MPFNRHNPYQRLAPHGEIPLSLASVADWLAVPATRTVHVTRSGSGTLAKLAITLLNEGRNVTVVARNQAELAEYRALLTLFNPERSLHDPSPTRAQWIQRFVSIPHRPAAFGDKSGWAERMAALYSLKKRRGVQGALMTVDNFLLRTPPANIFDSHELRLHKGIEMTPELILEQALDWGYHRVSLVNAPGDIAVRGNILDMFCPGYLNPLRLEFFGDILEDIRHFDPLSQRSVVDITELYMLPVSPVILSRDLRRSAEVFWQKEVENGRLAPSDVSGLSRMADAGNRDILCGLFYEYASCIEDWLPPDNIFILPGEDELAALFEEAERNWLAFLAHMEADTAICQPASRILRPTTEVHAMLSRVDRVYFETLQTDMPPTEEYADALLCPLPETHYRSFQEIFPRPEDQERPWQQLVSLMRAWSTKVSREKQDAQKNRRDHPSLAVAGKAAHEDCTPDKALAADSGGRLILTFSSNRSRSRFLNLAAQDGITPHLRYDEANSGLFALVSPFRKGLHLIWNNTLILGEDVLQPRVERTRKLPQEAFRGMDRHEGLNEGDLLVHRDYGIGIFSGLHRMDLGGTQNDYLLLLYAGDDKLYLPVDRLSLIQRFKGAEGSSPLPDRLGGAQWTASKEKAKKAIEKIAADLVQMYAARKVEKKNFHYAPVDELYREFEASFGFEETPDQAKAIEDVLEDMEKAEPMDRLICGDVGFGKTEVALRATFRATLEGRQVALLCPTTVLAEQHYQTFRSRLAGFPVNIGILSRFVSRSKQKEVLDAVAKGQIDMLIGTHRLLSKDVIIPHLGLLILDEEQRFGVRHKERLKELRKNVDALTLTATPIPRTLQLSLSGIRELSIIETPPPERKPVATALIDRDDATLRGILERELNREGQVFWVYNRVQGLEQAAGYVRRLAPQARIGIAHGQMSETELEESMHKFWHGELDILVCTSIIESGLDFPRANTLIVDQAQMFGLGQLYQLRGRVGRSDRQAFAVFITSEPDKLPELARQRMRIILEMDYLGAGFRVAMEDLRLRGAGNILGEAQTGHMNRLGLDLFLEMLEEAVAKLKGEPVRNHRETELSVGVPAFIPKFYMEDSMERLRYYKLLSSSQDDESQQDTVFEIRDRFGTIPDELENFISILSFKRYLSKRAVNKAEIFPDKLRLSFAEDAPLDPTQLIEFVIHLKAQGENVHLYPPAVLELPLHGSNVEERLSAARSILARLLEQPDDARAIPQAS
ncbi:MAG: transcription-repair coupling factor [Desulfovibrio sp.]|jgi:transcription-repair coupling factor (superfamily II helicase)|nr:transcription-repair coupling factor [Desulfovibrio sp.]